jgi:cation diffusion facilitator CzcD-associated flavoprotein CzcO
MAPAASGDGMTQPQLRTHDLMNLDEGAMVHDVIVVGAGFGGIGVAIELKKLGINDFLVLEQADDLGGTWRDNSYPGLEVDIPSFSYSFKFEPKVWSQVYAPGYEVKEYAGHCADKYGVRPHMRFGQKVTEIRWDEVSAHWRVSVDGGLRLLGRYVIDASGFLVGTNMPDIEGLDGFAGKVMHTARWDHDYDLAGKRVALIGTGATAVQVGPAIADQVARLTVFQRRAIWLAPKPNRRYSARQRWLLRRVPPLQRALRALNFCFSEIFFGIGFVNYRRFPGLFSWCERALIKYMRRKVADPVLQDELVPDYTFVCKRPALSNSFYPMFNRDNVDLVTDAISHVASSGIVTKDGASREFDAIICATGFKIFDRTSSPTFEVTGKGGKNLGAWWDEHRYQAFLGVSICDFPNFFMIYGPYAAIGTSYFDILDSSVTHISRVLRTARRRGADIVEVRPSAQEHHMRRIRRRAPRMVLYAGNCAASNSYYFDRFGDSPGGPAPSSPAENWLRTRLFPMSNYTFAPQRISGLAQGSIQTARQTATAADP